MSVDTRRNRKRRYTPEQRVRWNFKTRYGISIEEWQRMFDEQGGVCAICKSDMKRPVVDHDHDTGKVRSILCHPCNIKLPAVEDDSFLHAAKAYLEAHA